MHQRVQESILKLFALTIMKILMKNNYENINEIWRCKTKNVDISIIMSNMKVWQQKVSDEFNRLVRDLCWRNSYKHINIIIFILQKYNNILPIIT